MEPILDAGIDFILFAQGFATPATDRFFAAFTKLGSTGYLLLVPLAMWCIDFRLGVRIALAMAVTLFVNTTLKEWIGLDRPYLADDRIVSDGAIGKSMPSGHAQLVVAYWTLLAMHVRRRWFWGFAVAWMGLMGFSRSYLGVHYPSDVALGWAIGAATTWGLVAQRETIDEAIGAWSARGLVTACTAIALAAFGFDALAVGDPTYTNAGTIGFALGTTFGGAWTLRRGHFSGAGDLWQKALRLALGFVLGIPLLRVMQGLGAPPDDLGTRAVVVIDLAVFGFFLAGVMPWLFERVLLARRPDDLGEAC